MSESPSYYAYVGARTSRERNAQGDGLNVYKVDGESGEWTHLQLVTDLVNPSFLAFDLTGRFLYSVHGDNSEVSSFAIDSSTGRVELLNQQSTEGKNPVHLSFDKTNQFLVVANYRTSTLALLHRADDGSLDPVVDLASISGTPGPHRKEQPSSEPHHVEFDPSRSFVVAPDKGLDRVFTFRVDTEAGKLIEVSSVQTRENAGPRHIAFHPGGRLAYVINELDSSVTGYHFDVANGALDPFQIAPSVPDTFTGNSRAAEIAVSADGRFLYASNRGHDSIAAFQIDADSGRLHSPSWQPSGGPTPRFFGLEPSGRRLYAANEQGHTIVPFEIDPADGTLRQRGEVIETGSPVCIIFQEVA